MSNVLPAFDPTAGSGTFDSTLYNISGALVIHNLGIFDIQFTYPDSTQFIVDANSVRCKHLAGGFSAPIAWRTVTVPNTNNPYTATVIIEAYRAGTDEIPPEFIVPLTRQANVGGIVSSVSQVIQDAQPNGQILVEATPTGQPQHILITTDGAAFFTGPLSVGPASWTWVAGGPDLVAQTPQSGAVNGYAFRAWSGATQNRVFALGGNFDGAATWIGQLGNIGELAGQATAGSFGVPVIVAQTIDQNVTTTAVTTILSLTLPATGLYRINGSIKTHNGNVNQSPLLSVTYTGGDTGVSSTFNNFMVAGPGTFLDGGHTIAPDIQVAIASFCIYAAAGSLTVTYQDAAGTPNDRVTIILERLS